MVGNPIGHTFSPAIHNAAFDETGEDAVFLPFQAASREDFSRFAAAFGVCGASVTAPFKEALAEGVDCSADGPARRLGVLNTLKASPGGWQGRNSDAAGFLAPLDARGVRLDGLRASVLGSGGAARAVAFALAGRGARVTVHGRSADAAGRAAAVAPGAVATASPVTRGGWDLLVNATPVGTWPEVDRAPVDEGVLGGGGIVYDLVYNPARTRLLAEAASAGCAVIAGLEMLVAQAARQFEWWTGRPAPVAAMRAAAESRAADTDLAGDR